MNTTTEKAAMIPRALGNLSLNQAGEVATVLNPQSGHIFVINPVAQRIVELCDGQRTVGGIIKIIATEFAAPSQEQIVMDIEQFLTKASEKGLIVWD